MAKIDFKFLLPFVAALLEKDKGNVGKAARWVKENPQVISEITDAIKELVNKDKTDFAPGVVVPNPTVTVTIPPAIGPVPDVPPKIRMAKGIKLKAWFEVEGNVVSKEEADRILSGQDPLPGNGHSKIHLDGSPFDEFGVEIAPGDPSLRQFGTIDGAQVQTVASAEKGLDLAYHKWDRDYGFTPFIKVQKAEVDNKDYKVEIYQTVNNLKSNVITLRVKR